MGFTFTFWSGKYAIFHCLLLSGFEVWTSESFWLKWIFLRCLLRRNVWMLRSEEAIPYIKSFGTVWNLDWPHQLPKLHARPQCQHSSEFATCSCDWTVHQIYKYNAKEHHSKLKILSSISKQSKVQYSCSAKKSSFSLCTVSLKNFSRPSSPQLPTTLNNICPLDIPHSPSIFCHPLTQNR